MLDGDLQADVSGDASFDVSGDGRHTLEHWATDALGDEETHHTGHVDIDTAAPATTDDYAGGSAWQTGPVSLSLTADDTTSGVDVIVTGDGARTIIYRSTDAAGNTEATRTATVLVDTLAPVTCDDLAEGPPAHGCRMTPRS